MSGVVNAWAFVVLGVAGFSYFFFSAFVDLKLGPGGETLLLGLFIAGAAGLCRLRGIEGKILGVSMWIWGLLLSMVAGLHGLGAVATLFSAAGAMLLFGGVYLWRRGRARASRWPEARAALEEARLCSAGSDLQGTWIALARALDEIPMNGPENGEDPGAAETREHLRAIIELTLETFAPTLSVGQRDRLEQLLQTDSSDEGHEKSEGLRWLHALVDGRGV